MSSDSSRPSGPGRPGPTQDEQLLVAPVAIPDRRVSTSSEPWRVLRIMGEFVEGFDTLSGVRNAVCIFGSARTKPGFTHELVHIVRFCNFSQRFEVSTKDREKEERIVHATTYEILKELSLPRLDYILNSYETHRVCDMVEC